MKRSPDRPLPTPDSGKRLRGVRLKAGLAPLDPAKSLLSNPRSSPRLTQFYSDGIVLASNHGES
jgi:hypothetical protein